MDLNNKCIAFFLALFLVIIVVAIVGLATPSSDPTKWQALRERAANSSLHSNNGTDAVYGEENNAPPLEMAAIGQYASNRDAVALDKTGQGKPKWYLHFDETVFKFNSRTNVNALNGASANGNS